MSATALPNQLAISAIDAYQTYLSPHKRFDCPHRLLYGQSCSDSVKQLLLNQNLTIALKLAPQQFRACKLAAQSLQQAQGGCIVIPCCIPI